MITQKKEKNAYVQPDCQVFQVKLQQMIVTSPQAASENEEYEVVSTSSWF